VSILSLVSIYPVDNTYFDLRILIREELARARDLWKRLREAPPASSGIRQNLVEAPALEAVADKLRIRGLETATPELEV
jgi:hypothetical protein